jgi:dTDP-4-dehydrorhamnose 3,5-epimerase
MSRSIEAGADLDPSVRAARRDLATVTKSGSVLGSRIEGVHTRQPPTHVDHRGTVFEIVNDDPEYWQHPIVYAYQFSVHPGQVKGWGLHERKHDRYTLLRGDLLTILHDARPASPTHGVTQKVVLSERGTRQLTIPPFVWHMNVALGTTEVILVNHPTEVYHHADPDRLLLPPDTPEIPVDVSEYYPKQWGRPGTGI